MSPCCHELCKAWEVDVQARRWGSYLRRGWLAMQLKQSGNAERRQRSSIVPARGSLLNTGMLMRRVHIHKNRAKLREVGLAGYHFGVP